MAGVRRSARTRGKSDPIDALAVARAALREPDLPVARLDGPSREVRLLVDYRESVVKGTVPRPRTGCGGVSTSSNPATTRPQVHWIVTRPSPPSTSSSIPTTLSSPSWRDVRSPGFGNSPGKRTSSNLSSGAGSFGRCATGWASCWRARPHKRCSRSRVCRVPWNRPGDDLPLWSQRSPTRP